MTDRTGRVSRAWRGMVAAGAAGALTVGIGSVVLADDVSNTLDASVDAAAEVMALNVGGATGATSLSITPRGGDGKSGCNLTGSTTLVVSVSSSNTSVATVSPSSVTFSSCGDVKAIAVTPVGTGSTTVSLSQVSNNTGGTFSLAPATFTVNVAPPANSAPTVSVTGVTGGASYEHGAVPVAGCSVTDAEDGASSFAASLSSIGGPLSSFGLGSQEASCSYTDAGGSTASSSVTYSIVDTGKPVITLSSRTAANGNGWNNTDVIVAWSCSDPVSGVVAATVAATVSTEGADQSATGTCTDGAGNSTSATETNIDIDKTAPVATFVSREPPPNAAGWNNAAVVVTWSCADAGGSGVVSATVSDAVDTEGVDQQATGSCEDLAGNTSTASVGAINIDTTPPAITKTSRTTANANGWNNTAVTVVWTCTDTGSGAQESSVTNTVSSEGADQTTTGTCTDLAGNTASATETNVNIDTTPPSITWIAGPAAGSAHIFGSVPAAATCSGSDALSGVSGGCQVTGYATTVGTHTMTATATDAAGNTTELSRTFTVLPWTLRGFFQPVDMNGVWNTVKGGSTVPLKFEVFAGTTELTDPSIAAFGVAQVACSTGAGADEIEFTTTGGTALRYDATSGQFIQNWQTPKQTGACYRVTMTTADGSTLTALFKLK